MSQGTIGSSHGPVVWNYNSQRPLSDSLASEHLLPGIPIDMYETGLSFWIS